MEKWRIKTGRDWMIAFLFATLLVYAVLGIFTGRINRMLMYVTDPRLSDLNQPSGYGNVALTALIMGAVTGAVLLVKKQPFQRAALSLAAGCILAAVSIGAYFYHCSLLVHVPQEEMPGRVSVQKGWDHEQGRVNENFDPGDEKLAAFVELCTSLKELPKAQQKQAGALYDRNRSSDREEEIRIWISYPEKYLHSYSLLLWIDNGQIFALRDGGKDRRFFEDNGLVQAAEELLLRSGQ